MIKLVRKHYCKKPDKGREALSPDNKDAFTIPDLGELLSDIDEQSLSDEQKQLQKEKVYNLHSERSSKIHYLSQLLKAYTLFDKDVEYVVQNGQVLKFLICVVTVMMIF